MLSSVRPGHRRDLRGRTGASWRGGRPARKPHGLPELRHRRPQPSRLIGREDPGEPGYPGARVAEQFQDRRFVDDSRAHQIGMAGDQVECDDRSRTAPEHARRATAMAGDQRHRVPDIGEDPVRVVDRTVDRTTGKPPPRVGDHGEVPGQPARHAGNTAGSPLPPTTNSNSGPAPRVSVYSCAPDTGNCSTTAPSTCTP
jgi:hypothetical protein